MQCDERWLENKEISILYVGDVISTGIFLQVQWVGWSKSSIALCLICGAEGWGLVKDCVIILGFLAQCTRCKLNTESYY